MSSERQLVGSETVFQVPVNWPYEGPQPVWAKDLDGCFPPPSYADGAILNDGAQSLVPVFRATRYELAILARHYLDELMLIRFNDDFRRLTNETDWKFVALAGGRVALIEMLLGTDEYRAAVSEIKQKWAQEFSELEEDKKACRKCQTSTDNRPHMLCVWEAQEGISPLAAEFPGLTEEQAQLIFDRKPFIGMTLKQAEAAFGCLQISCGSRINREAQELEWEVSKSGWGTKEKWVLTFLDGKLAKIEDGPKGE